MRYAIVGDVHANMPALRAVLAELADERVDAYLCPGDLVGYGPMPNEVVAAMAALDAITVAGNHDLIALGELSTDRCSPLARRTLEWTREALDDSARAALGALPPSARADGVLIAHGSVDDPQEYVRTAEQAHAQLERMRSVDGDAQVLLLGHTHVPMAVGERSGQLLLGRAGTVRFDGGERMLLNAGSIGQSRDQRPRARYAIVDTDRAEAVFRAVRYDTAAVQRALREAGLPEDAHHARPTVGSPVGQAIVQRVPRPARRAIRRVRRWVVR